MRNNLYTFTKLLSCAVITTITVHSQVVYAEGTRDLHKDENRGMLKQEAYSADADNTARNQRDRNSGVVLPEDQSNQQLFLERSAAIRKEIVANDTLSINAKNIKIVTLNDGMVVLRGVANSTEEKSTLEQIAKNHSDDAKVLSYIEIAPAK